ncbi:MAG: hypothetical protein CTY13_02150 [Methylobacter sp.]|nr:MAG: hypothetical protein CTY13_02150 [Methylobacter sp.]
MSNTELFFDHINMQLRPISRKKKAAFAMRAAMRMLPLLAVSQIECPEGINQGMNDPFDYWKNEDKNKNLLLIFRCYVTGLEWVLTNNVNIGIAIELGKAVTDINESIISAYEEITSSNFIAASSVLNTTKVGFAAGAATMVIIILDKVKAKVGAATRVADVNATSNAAKASSYSAAFNKTKFDVIKDAVQQDLVELKNKSANDFLMQSLWPAGMPDSWQTLWDQFRVDALNLNAGFDVWLDWYGDRLTGKAIDVELLQQWNRIPDAINAQVPAKTNAYLKNLLQKNIGYPLNRVRAIFIGYGEAGKTSLIRALHDEDVVEGKEPMTAGVEIRDWPVPETDIQAHLWDFGGQVVFHATHKFFLRSSCVYVVVINARADINNSEQAEYWLEHVKVFGNSAPVLLVGSKADEAEIRLQMENLTQKYPNIKGFYAVSCTQAKTSRRHEFEAFKQALSKELQAVGIHQILFTPAQGRVLKELQKNALTDAFMGAEQFQRLCNECQVSDEGELNRAWLIDIFDKLGVMLHFEELKTFHDAYLLNPRWLTHGVYTLTNAKQARISESDMVQILAETKVQDEYQHLLSYPAEKCLFISKAMQRFKLCYPLEKSKDLLIPALLADELPRYPPELQNSETLHFEFAFDGFLPRNLISEFMVTRHEEIIDGLQSQRGAAFKSRSLKAEALVEADYHRRSIDIQVYGRDAKEYLMVLYDEMKGVFGDLALEYREWVDLPAAARIDEEVFGLELKIEKAPYQQLLAFARKKQRVYISESGFSYDLGMLLGVFLTEEGQKKAGIIIQGDYYEGDKKVSEIEIDISNSTIHGSVVAAKTIENSFNSLQQSQEDNQVNQLLAVLLREIQDLNSKVPASQTIEDMSQDAQSLIAETQREKPRPNRLGVSLEGIKEAAQTLGDIAKPVFEVAEKIGPLLLSIGMS